MNRLLAAFCAGGCAAALAVALMPAVSQSQPSITQHLSACKSGWVLDSKLPPQKPFRYIPTQYVVNAYASDPVRVVGPDDQPIALLKSGASAAFDCFDLKTKETI